MEGQDEPVEKETWPELREAQTLALELPETGMAVTIDIGETDDIHPRNKHDVGYRLAQAALYTSYGKEVTPSGPMFSEMKVEDGVARLSFEYAESGLLTPGDEPLAGFAVAGADSMFHWAHAEIEDAEILVSHPDVAEPVAVRYGWANNPTVNLFNGEGLPASPFRTDDWPWITEGNH
jgi:sialate O-acetylesterase